MFACISRTLATDSARRTHTFEADDFTIAAHRIVGQSARAHEFGGRYKRQRYPKRPFMGPALTKTKDRLPKHWAGSIK